jgi:hypothetical protein
MDPVEPSIAPVTQPAPSTSTAAVDFDAYEALLQQELVFLSTIETIPLPDDISD